MYTYIDMVLKKTFFSKPLKAAYNGLLDIVGKVSPFVVVYGFI